MVSLKIAEVKPSRSVPHLEESSGMFLSMFAFPQCRFRFAPQNDPSAGYSGAVNFRVARDPGIDPTNAALSHSIESVSLECFSKLGRHTHSPEERPTPSQIVAAIFLKNH